MKFWLFDILACPICKHFPLTFYIISYEHKEETFRRFIESYQQKETASYKKNQIPEIIKHENNQIFIKDHIVIQETPLKAYLDKVISSIMELHHVVDNSSLSSSKLCLDLLRNDVKKKIDDFRNIPNYENIENILPELNFLNKIKIEIEIKTGILFCNKCNRWYPIIDSIPRMLPDEYRNKTEETQFLEDNKSNLSKEFVNKDLKPFNLN
ncbi:MAG: hypothetical protein BAJALOKI1v1_740008 [Promethearchaeota archaeon]|nr:MAG: hypothetical protein BAJALOKI1v1_740008 [Candidatus Lokiarchaeota archaeon]